MLYEFRTLKPAGIESACRLLWCGRHLALLRSCKVFSPPHRFLAGPLNKKPHLSSTVFDGEPKSRITVGRWSVGKSNPEVPAKLENKLLNCGFWRANSHLSDPCHRCGGLAAYFWRLLFPSDWVY